MKMMEIQYLEYLPAEFADQAIALYFSALSAKLEPILGNIHSAREALERTLATDRCLAAVRDQQLLGMMGIQTVSGGFLNPTLNILVKHYGVFGGILRLGGLSLLHHRTVSGELYVDGVAVAAEHRGRGIGSHLFSLLEKVALKMGIRKITLEIIDTNHRAKTLYERLGFVQTKEQTVRPFNLIFKFPFKSAILMEKNINF